MASFVSQRNFALSLLGMVLIGILVGTLHSRYPLVAKARDGRFIWPWGLQVNPNPTHSKDVADAKEQLRRAHKAIKSYVATFGRFPTTGVDLTDSSIPIGARLKAGDLMPAGYRTSDAFALGQESVGLTLELLSSRPDGTLRPLNPQSGQRDAWVSSDMFVRSNARVYPNWTAERKPSGFYLVLWSDGSIEEVPYERVRLVQIGNAYSPFFPGQAGSKVKSISLADFERQLQNAVPAGVGSPLEPN